MEVHRIYCDRQSCRSQLDTYTTTHENQRCKAIIKIYDARKREIALDVDLCFSCAEKLKNILSEFFNDGSNYYKFTGEEKISTEWKPIDSKF